MRRIYLYLQFFSTNVTNTTSEVYKCIDKEERVSRVEKLGSSTFESPLNYMKEQTKTQETATEQKPKVTLSLNRCGIVYMNKQTKVYPSQFRYK